MAQENQEWLGPSVGLFEFLILRWRILANDQNQHKTHIYVDWGVFCSVGSVIRWLSNASGDQSNSVNAWVNHLKMVEQCVWCHQKHNTFLSKYFPQCSLNQTIVSYMRMCPRDRWMLSYIGPLPNLQLYYNFEQLGLEDWMSIYGQFSSVSLLLTRE